MNGARAVSNLGTGGDVDQLTSGGGAVGGGGGKDGGFGVRGRRLHRRVRERAGGPPFGIKGAAFASDPQFSSTSSSQDKMKCIVSI